MEVVKDRVAIVSGACDAVGAAISTRLAQKGATVIVSDSDPAKVDALLEEIQAADGKALGMTVDAADPAQVKAFVAKTIADLGKVDILVNNVDTQNGTPIQEVSDALWQAGLGANLNAVFYFCRELVPHMRANQYGRIITIGNLEYMGLPGKSNYAAVKSAIFGLTRALALESARDDVTVNCVAKGDIASADMSPEAIEKQAKGIPVKRLGTPEDVARTVGFFASDTSKYITGQTFFVCGGKSAYFSMSI
ncbi:3-oxoacyl-[acyl-carrier-protein] reductase [Desulfosarcina cetonica]|uniref:SDR family NAD(P)-dependent oxidoreductase n=1 Tax=Desulfosarcina cetonica TaxID=90730 RepID=UPI0006D0CE41|nr:SDR family NAD(P)-dependent oxidoreductase [Desulfosarcina cetonica]